MTGKHSRYITYFICGLTFIAYVGLWLSVRDVQAKWINVPPAPSEAAASFSTLGDKQFAYRVIGLMLQNLGDTGGRVTPLYKYDYDALGKWFHLTDKLDTRSNFVPLLAAYYFGATQEPEDLNSVIEYLAMQGQRPGPNKWRWLSQAVYLSRFKQEDLNKALRHAETLAEVAQKNSDTPVWAKQMPAFIFAAKGDREAAYEIAMNLLKTQADELHPAEVKFLVDYICNRVLTAPESKKHPLCDDLK